MTITCRATAAARISGSIVSRCFSDSNLLSRSRGWGSRGARPRRPPPGGPARAPCPTSSNRERQVRPIAREGGLRPRPLGQSKHRPVLRELRDGPQHPASKMLLRPSRSGPGARAALVPPRGTAKARRTALEGDRSATAVGCPISTSCRYVSASGRFLDPTTPFLEDGLLANTGISRRDGSSMGRDHHRGSGQSRGGGSVSSPTIPPSRPVPGVRGRWRRSSCTQEQASGSAAPARPSGRLCRCLALPSSARCFPGGATRAASFTTRCVSADRSLNPVAFRPQRRWRCLHPRLLRRDLHGRGKRVHVSGLTAHGGGSGR